jgi:hypothetical protein
MKDEFVANLNDCLRQTIDEFLLHEYGNSPSFCGGIVLETPDEQDAASGGKSRYLMKLQWLCLTNRTQYQGVNMKWLKPGCITLVVTLVPVVASAQFYKCTNSNGKIEFSDKPCAAETRKEHIAPRANTIDTSGFREQMMRQEISELRERAERAERQAAAQASGTGRSGADLQAERIDSRACEVAKRDYEMAAGSISQNGRVIAARRSAMYGACGMREPDVIVQPTIRERRSASLPSPSAITSCDAGGCWDNTGGRYNKGGGNTYFGPRGACQNIGGMMHCP